MNKIKSIKRLNELYKSVSQNQIQKISSNDYKRINYISHYNFTTYNKSFNIPEYNFIYNDQYGNDGIYLTTKDVENEIGRVDIDENLIAVPMVIPFNEKGEPMLDNQRHKEDYKLLKTLFTDPDVMKSTGFNLGNVLTRAQLNPIISSCVRHKEEERNGHYGLYKVLDLRLGKYIGVQGMTILKDREGNVLKSHADNPVIESLTLIGSEYLRNGYGSKLIDWSFTAAENRKDIVIYTVRIDNDGTKAICKKHRPVHLGIKNVGGKEDFRGKVDVFIPLASYKRIENYPEFIEELVNSQTSAVQTNKIKITERQMSLRL